MKLATMTKLSTSIYYDHGDHATSSTLKSLDNAESTLSSLEHGTELFQYNAHVMT